MGERKGEANQADGEEKERWCGQAKRGGGGISYPNLTRLNLNQSHTLVMWLAYNLGKMTNHTINISHLLCDWIELVIFFRRKEIVYFSYPQKQIAIWVFRIDEHHNIYIKNEESIPQTWAPGGPT